MIKKFFNFLAVKFKFLDEPTVEPFCVSFETNYYFTRYIFCTQYIIYDT